MNASMRLAGTFIGMGLCALGLPASGGITEPPPQSFRISLSEPGIYRVSYERLAAAGLAAPVSSRRLGLTHQGRPVPIFVSDGGDGLFGPGDQVEFEGDRLAGEGAYLNAHTSANVYVLATGGGEAARFEGAAAVPEGDGAGALRVDLHLERDLLLLRFAQAAVEPDLWTWAKLTPLDAEPFRLPLDLEGLDTASQQPVRVRVRFKGWSSPREKPAGWPDHRVEASVDGGSWVVGEWEQAQSAFVLDLPPLSAREISPGAVELTLRVPRRTLPSGDPFVDISVLDWVEVSYPHGGTLRAEQTRLTLAAGANPCLAAPAGSAVLYGAGIRLAGLGERGCARGLPAGPFWAVRDGRLREPESVELDTPSDLASRERQADYLMIVHRRLRAAIEPLAAFHLGRGLSVEVVDIQDVYDEWSHGIGDPRALRSFLEHAWKHWRRPAPRFVLLVGDASWDGKNRRGGEQESPDATYAAAHGNQFPAIPSTPYEEARLDNRNLIPTWSYPTSDGHAAGDNHFAALDGDDINPVLAIGRFPVTEPVEVEAIVAKILRYAGSVEDGPWRREVLFVTTDDTGWQQWSNDLAARIGERGFVSSTVYPRPGALPGEADQTALREALARGQLLVHFIGHGGRFIWRTGPPDWTKQTDLFNLKDVDLLPESGRLPVVLSMTCYSAPFDHPTADSIGEKLLRAPGKGAIAVFAASWRNTPTYTMSLPLVDELLKPGTLGEAIVRAKRRSFNRTLIEQYNLLGDPALPLAVPEGAADLNRP